jgi:hypothetical protein
MPLDGIRQKGKKIALFQSGGSIIDALNNGNL